MITHLTMFSRSTKVEEYYSGDSLDLEFNNSSVCEINGPLITCLVVLI